MTTPAGRRDDRDVAARVAAFRRTYGDAANPLSVFLAPLQTEAPRMTETQYRRELLEALRRIAAALEAHNAADPLRMIQDAIEGANGALGTAECPLGPLEAMAGALAVYLHPAGEGWRIVARRDTAAPSGWAIIEERVNGR